MLVWSLVSAIIGLSQSQFQYPPNHNYMGQNQMGHNQMGHNQMPPRMVPQLTADRICNNPNGCTFMCTNNRPCVGPYICGSKSGRCTYICEHDACQDATFISLSKKHTQFNCLGEHGCEYTQMYCGSIPPTLAGVITNQPVGLNTKATCDFVCRRNACRHSLMRCDNVKQCSFRAQNPIGSGGTALQDSEIVCNMNKRTGRCAVYCGGGLYGHTDPQCEGSVLNCIKGKCTCSGATCGAGLIIHGNAVHNPNSNLVPPQYTNNNPNFQTNNPPRGPRTMQNQNQNQNQIHNQYNPNSHLNYPPIPNYGNRGLNHNYHHQSQFINNQMSSTVHCHEPPICANKITTCLRQNCKFECHEPGSCSNAIIKASLTTQVLEIQCDKPGSCNGLTIISSAPTTKVYCHDYGCTSISLTCNSYRGEICMLECGSDGCQPQNLASNIAVVPPHNFNPHNPHNPHNYNNIHNIPRITGNKVSCLGFYKDCYIKAKNEFSFLNGNFTCAMTGGSCLLECSDHRREVSCRGATYLCNSLNPAICKCHDIRQNRFYSPIPNRNYLYDCPPIIYPKFTYNNNNKPNKNIKKVIKKKTVKKIIKKNVNNNLQNKQTKKTKVVNPNTTPNTVTVTPNNNATPILP